MNAQRAPAKPAIGFLTVLEHAQHGLFGGLLVLNAQARPLEFHCTAPIKPNRAQEILYGPTLEAFLYGDQIGRTLLEKSRSELLFLCTDRQPAMTVREHTALPVALVIADQEAADDDRQSPCDGGAFHRIDAAHAGDFQQSGPKLQALRLGRNQVALPETRPADAQLLQERFAALPATLDLVEPFGRIREAIEEAQQAVR